MRNGVVEPVPPALRAGPCMKLSMPSRVRPVSSVSLHISVHLLLANSLRILLHLCFSANSKSFFLDIFTLGRRRDRNREDVLMSDEELPLLLESMELLLDPHDIDGERV